MGTLGQTEYRDQGLAVCHICGLGFENLGFHVYAHDTWPDEYKAYFGLKRKQSLLSRGMQESGLSGPQPQSSWRLSSSLGQQEETGEP